MGQLVQVTVAHRALVNSINATRQQIADARKLLRKHGVNDLLTVSGNPKAEKSLKLGAWEAVLHFAPSKLSGFNVCKDASPECIRLCLNTAGNPLFKDNKRKARKARTLAWFNHANAFRIVLVAEIRSHIARSKAAGLTPVFRLNGTSDIAWETEFPELFEAFSQIQFFDYTKTFNRLGNTPHNYYLTFSRSESNWGDCLLALSAGHCVTAVIGNCGISAHPRQFPETHHGFDVIDGDTHDLRYLDKPGSVVMLRAKGKARKAKRGGFVIDVHSDPSDCAEELERFESIA